MHITLNHLLSLTILACVIVPALRDTSYYLALMGLVGMFCLWEWISKWFLCGREPEVGAMEQERGGGGEREGEEVVGPPRIEGTPIYDEMMREERFEEVMRRESGLMGGRWGMRNVRAFVKTRSQFEELELAYDAESDELNKTYTLLKPRHPRWSGVGPNGELDGRIPWDPSSRSE